MTSSNDSLYSVIEESNKFDRANVPDMWEFWVLGVGEVVGYIRDSVQKEMFWDQRNFVVEEDKKRITLRPRFHAGEDCPASCAKALSDLCLINHWRFKGCLESWRTTQEDKRPFHIIHNSQELWQNLHIPLPLRGLLGVITVGVHLNMYTVKMVDGKEEVDKIWVAQRSTQRDRNFAGMLDQVVAGALDVFDRIDGSLAPAATLKREAAEEAGLDYDIDTKTMSILAGWRRITLGPVESIPYITYYDCKDANAGRTLVGHLEPGVRFVYDLKLTAPDFQPTKREVNIEKFEAHSVDGIKTTLREKRWKPNCGLVMLDFLIRKGLVTAVEEPRIEEMKTALRGGLPFEYIEKDLPFMTK